jgi:hypothetical protein
MENKNYEFYLNLKKKSLKWNSTFKNVNSGTAHIRHQCRKIAVLSCHRFLISSGVEKMNKI